MTLETGPSKDETEMAASMMGDENDDNYLAPPDIKKIS
jgi:hypothetical protein